MSTTMAATAAEDPAVDRRAAGGASVAGATWTILSRATGFVRAVTIAAVLGATYVGNTYQAVNQLPNLAFGVLTGGLFGTLLVPTLVRRLDAADPGRARELAGGFTAMVLLASLVVGAVAVAAGQLILGVLSIGVADSEVAGAQRDTGWLLLVLVMPQIALYAIAGTGTAVLNAHGRFALPAAAPVLENVGIIVTLGVWALAFDADTGLHDLSTGAVLVLGVGSTLAVGLHAGLIAWGAHRTGTSLTPRAGWRNPDVVHVARLTVSSFGYTGLTALLYWAPVVAANSVPGGVVAFALAINFTTLPIAIGTTPVANAFLPTLSRLRQADALDRFRDEFSHAVSLALFVAVPAAVAYAILSEPLAEAVAFGEMDTDRGTRLLASTLATMAPGVVGLAAYTIALRASYALEDVKSPLLASMVKAAVLLPGVGIALSVSGDSSVPATLGLAWSASELAGAWYLGRRVRRGLPAGGGGLVRSLGRAFAGALAMALPAYGAATRLDGVVGDLGAFIIAAVVGAAVFVAAGRLLRSPELDFFVRGVGALRRRGREER